MQYTVATSGAFSIVNVSMIFSFVFDWLLLKLSAYDRKPLAFSLYDVLKNPRFNQVTMSTIQIFKTCPFSSVIITLQANI